MSKLLYWLGSITFKLYFKFFKNIEIKGKKNQPKSGPVIIMSNHISLLDPLIIGCTMNRPVFFMAKNELFKNPIASWVLKKIGVIPVKRGKADRKALRQAFNVLKKNKVLGIFPEGTRNKPPHLGNAKPGSIMIALKSKSPILPIAIKQINNKKDIKISIGKPFTLDNYYDKKLSKEQKNEVGYYLMKKIKKELLAL